MSDNNEPTDSDGIRSLRAAAERGAAAQAELEQVRRENLFLKAGISTDKGPGKLLFQASTSTTVDELLAEANEYGITPGSAAPPTLIVADDRGDVRRALADLPAAGAVEQPTPDPVENALENFWNERKRGVPQDRAQLGAIDRVIVAAANGDPRAMFNREEWKAKLESGG